MMEAVSSSERLVNFYETKRRNLPLDYHLLTIILTSFPHLYISQVISCLYDLWLKIVCLFVLFLSCYPCALHMLHISSSFIWAWRVMNLKFLVFARLYPPNTFYTSLFCFHTVYLFCSKACDQYITKTERKYYNYNSGNHVDGAILRLWTAATNGPIIHPPGVVWHWEPWWNNIDKGKLLIRPRKLSGNSASSHLVAKREEVVKKLRNFALQSISFLLRWVR
jgi:hypothetical protein